MTPAELARAVSGAVCRAAAAGELDVAVPGPEAVRLTRGRGAGQGEYATGIALRLAGPAGLPARTVAERLAHRLATGPDAAAIARVDVAGPGFLNVTLAPAAHAALIRAARAAGAHYGTNDAMTAVTTAPEAPADARSAAVVRLLRACGATVAEPASPAAVTGLGADATAWALTRPPAGDAPDLNPATHLPQRAANPLFRIRYAHARARALLRNGADLGLSPAEGEWPHPAEAALLGVVGDWPRVVESAARHRAPDRVARALESTADAFFDFHDAVAILPRGDEKPGAGHRSRLALAAATAAVLACGLALLGISAPDHL